MVSAVRDVDRSLMYRGTRLGFIPQSITVWPPTGDDRRAGRTGSPPPHSSPSSSGEERRTGGRTQQARGTQEPQDPRAASSRGRPSTCLIMHFLECDIAASGSGSGSRSGSSGVVRDLLRPRPKPQVYSVARGAKQLDLVHKAVTLRNQIMGGKAGESCECVHCLSHYRHADSIMDLADTLYLIHASTATSCNIYFLSGVHHDTIYL